MFVKNFSFDLHFVFIITKSFQVEKIICNFTYNTDDSLTGQQNGRKNIQYHQ